PGDALSGLVTIDVQNGRRKLFATSDDMIFRKPVWLPDGSGLVVLSFGVYGLQTQIGFVSFPGGKLSRVTRDTNSYTDLSLAADGQTLATVLGQTHLNLYVSEAGSNSTTRQLASAPQAHSVSWTRAGQLLISTARGLVLLNSESGTQTPLLSQFSS